MPFSKKKKHFDCSFSVNYHSNKKFDYPFICFGYENYYFYVIIETEFVFLSKHLTNIIFKYHEIYIYIISSILLLFFSVNGFSQIPKSQPQVRVNFTMAPGLEFTKVAGDYNMMGSFSANMTFNGKIYLGGYVSKKILPVLHTDFLIGQTNDVSVQHAGISIGGNIVKIKTKNSYVIRKSKIRFTYGVRIGGGALWLNDDNWTKVSTRDYFYIVQPSLGIFRPLGTFVTIRAGAYFQATYGVGKVGPFLTDKDFMSPGFYIALHINTFK